MKTVTSLARAASTPTAGVESGLRREERVPRSAGSVEAYDSGT